jgi:hypothetical protein
MILTEMAENLFVFPQAVAASGADSGKNDGNEIIYVHHGDYLCLIVKEAER